MVPFPNKDSTKYSKISIPYEMKIEIERIINTDKRLGFVSVQEFVKEEELVVKNQVLVKLS